MKDAIVILSFLTIGILLYFMIGRVFSVASLESMDQTAYKQMRIMTEDTVFLREIQSYLASKECRFYSGKREEIREEMRKNMPDLVILYEPDASLESPYIYHDSVKYYTSGLEMNVNGMAVYPLRYESRQIEIYYKKEMKNIILAMKESGVIVFADAKEAS